MRGNEAMGEMSRVVADEGFQIPMRGNEGQRPMKRAALIKRFKSP